MAQIKDQKLVDLNKEKRETLKQLDKEPDNVELKTKLEQLDLDIYKRTEEVIADPTKAVEIEMAKKNTKPKTEKVVKEKKTKEVKEKRVTNKSKCIAEFDKGNFDLKKIAEKHGMPLGTARTVYQEEKLKYGSPLTPSKKEKVVKEKKAKK